MSVSHTSADSFSSDQRIFVHNNSWQLATFSLISTLADCSELGEVQRIISPSISLLGPGARLWMPSQYNEEEKGIKYIQLMMKNLSRKTPSFSFVNLAKYLFLFLKRSLVQNYIALLYRLSAISNIQYPSSNPVIGVMELYWITKRLMLF